MLVVGEQHHGELCVLWVLYCWGCAWRNSVGCSILEHAKVHSLVIRAALCHRRVMALCFNDRPDERPPFHDIVTSLTRVSSRISSLASGSLPVPT